MIKIRGITLLVSRFIGSTYLCKTTNNTKNHTIFHNIPNIKNNWSFWFYAGGLKADI